MGVNGLPSQSTSRSPTGKLSAYAIADQSTQELLDAHAEPCFARWTWMYCSGRPGIRGPSLTPSACSSR